MFVCMTTLNISGLSIIALWGRAVETGGQGGNIGILADQQSLSQPGGAVYAHHITANYSFPRIF